jgi:hypothetical protein
MLIFSLITIPYSYQLAHSLYSAQAYSKKKPVSRKLSETNTIDSGTRFRENNTHSGTHFRENNTHSGTHFRENNTHSGTHFRENNTRSYTH